MAEGEDASIDTDPPVRSELIRVSAVQLGKLLLRSEISCVSAVQLGERILPSVCPQCMSAAEGALELLVAIGAGIGVGFRLPAGIIGVGLPVGIVGGRLGVISSCWSAVELALALALVSGCQLA
jgi:hypothetical protein